MIWLGALGSGCGDSSGSGRGADATNRDAVPADSRETAPSLPDTLDVATVVIDNPDADNPLVDGPDTALPAIDTPDAAMVVIDSPVADSEDNPDGDELDADRSDGGNPDAIFLPVDSLDAGPSDSAADTATDMRIDVPAVEGLAPTVSGSVYTYTFGDTIFAVDAAKGGRIVTFSLGGRNILTAAKNSGDNNWGSTLWPSPQSDWNWPPPAEIDPEPYTASLAGNILTLSSATASSLQLSATKKIFVDGAAGVVTIEYGLANRGTKARSVAPWEITRVAAAGLTFFPMGDGSPAKGSQDLLTLTLSGGVAWFAYDATKIPNDQKVFADGHEGWIAHVNGDVLLVKAFTDIPAAQAAPSEAEIELYTDAAHTYIEVENQGAYTRLAPGAGLSWTVRWYLRTLDSSVSVQVGSAGLLSTVRALVNR